MSGRPLKMVVTREPEKYSSAAPLSADARQRIVAELLDLQSFVTLSVTVGPASGVLKDLQPAQYKPYDVALTVLVDRCAADGAPLGPGGTLGRAWERARFLPQGRRRQRPRAVVGGGS